MKRLLPHPAIATALLALWLLLNATVDPAMVLLGVVLAILGNLAYARLAPRTEGMRFAPLSIASLIGTFALDIVRSNIAVALIILRPSSRGRVSGFLDMPLLVRSEASLACLAMIITATPGTSWAKYDAERNVVTIHVFDLVDADDWTRLFKERYERPLLEIFG